MAKRLPSHGKSKADLPHRIVADGLCVRCGACTGLCPKSLLSLDESCYPVLKDPDKRCDACGYCLSACPGGDVDIPELSLALFGRANDYFDILGCHGEALIASSTNDTIRRGASSGGVVTQVLVSLLEGGHIKKALVARMSPAEAWRGEPWLAASKEEIIDCAQSKYTIVPQMRLLGQLIASREEVAVVGLPCHIHALRKYQARFPERLRNVKLIIGLFCHSAIEIEGTLKMIERARVNREELRRIEYRGGEWPGQARAVLRDGRILPLHTGSFKDGCFNYLKYLYYPPRCLGCVDFSSELADLSVGDPWLRSRNGRFLFEGGSSLALVRTQRASEAIEIVRKRGDMATGSVASSLVAAHFASMRRYKKTGAQIRIEWLKGRALPYPRYHFDLPRPRFRDVLEEKLRSLTRLPGMTERGRDLGARIALSRWGDGLNVMKPYIKSLLARLRSV